MITVFTPTYNRGYILPKLYESLVAQTSKDFEWLIIDDASSDDTSALVSHWKEKDNGFQLRYFKNEVGGGKQRLINQALTLVNNPWFFIVDSDDQLTPDAIEKVKSWCKGVENDENFVGVSGIRCKANRDYIKQPLFNGRKYIDSTNLERPAYSLEADMAEVFKTEILRKYPFPVWHDEKFTPECVVWDQLALDGYKVRWYDEKIYICEYLEDGLTNGGNKLYIHNLIGCAMGENIKLKSSRTLREKYLRIREILVCCFLKGDLSYLKQTEYPIFAYLMIPIGFGYYLRRKRLFKDL